MAALLEAENVALDVGAYRSAPPGFRIWCGPTVEAKDLEDLTPWLRSLLPGDMLDACDTEGRWYEAKVVSRTGGGPDSGAAAAFALCCLDAGLLLVDHGMQGGRLAASALLPQQLLQRGLLRAGPLRGRELLLELLRLQHLLRLLLQHLLRLLLQLLHLLRRGAICACWSSCC